ncbi:MAG: nitroreductase [Patescibacteria group bacterium]|jgi:nitroreductase
MVLEGKMRQLITAATLAPSGENCQPWRFVINGNELQLFNVPERDDSLYNFRQRGSLVAHGALLENFTIAAKALGFNADIRLFPDAQNENLVAAIHLENAEPVADPLYAAITARSTNRKPYANESLTTSERESINAAGVSTSCRFVLIEQKESISTWATAASANERVMFEHHGLHDFFFSHLNWTDAEEQERRHGFYIKTLELQPPQVIGMKIAKHWAVASVLNRLGLSKQVAADNIKSNSAAAAIGGVVIHGERPQDFVEAGRIVERVWLTVTNLGLSLQPITGALFLAELVREGDASVFSPAHVALLQEVERTAEKLCGADSGERVAMMFRIGRGEPPSGRSSRLRLEEFVTSTQPA